MTRALAVLAVLFGLVALATTVDSRSAQGCAFNQTPTTFEAQRNRSAYMISMDLAGFNMIAPNDNFFGTPRVENGARHARGTTTPYIPPKLLKGISMVESNAAHADYSVYWQSTGPVKVSFDCGFGIMQITSGMVNPNDGNWPSKQQALVTGHYMYNIGRGASILVEKWNSAPEVRPIVGNGDPRVVENWYYALWSYNGFASVNNPLRYGSWPRTDFSCGPANDGYGHNRGNYPYQELVYGCAEHPARVDGVNLWSPQPVTLPNLNDSRWRDPLSRFPDASQMDFPTPGPSHTDNTPRPGNSVPGFLRGSPQLWASHTSIAGNSAEVTIRNTGSGILAWRAKPQQSWINVSKQAGVVLGSDVSCTAGQPCDRSTTLTVSVNTAAAPQTGGGQVVIESLTNGQTWTIFVPRDGNWPYRIGVPGTSKR